ncbi:MAG: MerR family transcriptional regulator [Acidobacteria bacterium]|nr:MerR family transcriptional regulator [Acidobacteriota bacterium]
MPDAETPQIPDRLYFRIGDVSQLVGVEPYVLRFWETEFPMLQPKKGKAGHREYKRKDVELILEIKRLLYDEGFTISGARKALKEKTRPGRKKAAATDQVPLQFSASTSKPRPSLKELRKELEEIVNLLKKDR